MLTKIICGFFGVGKSYFKNNTDKLVLDTDSSLFSCSKSGVRNSEFPQNYIDYIQDNIGKVDIILVSPHKVVRDSLLANRISFMIVYPDKNLKQEYLEQFKKRECPKEFIEMLLKNWNNFINEIENFPDHIMGRSGIITKFTKIKLQKDEYLSDYIKTLDSSEENEKVDEK
jgi:hypothetical protein